MSMSMKRLFTMALEHRGWSLTKKTRLYDVFSRRDRPYNLYVGKAGALRRGKNATNNRPLSDNTKHRLQEEGKHILYHGALETFDPNLI